MTYQAWDHTVQIAVVNGRWTVAVDEMLFGKWFMSEAEAWEAGVREADRLESTKRPSADPFGMTPLMRQ